jgi:hypothetical protein
MAEDNNKNDWQEYKRLLLSELERLSISSEKIRDEFRKEHEAIREEIKKINENLITLNLKAGVWGALAGAIPGLIVLVVYLLQKHVL